MSAIDVSHLIKESTDTDEMKALKEQVRLTAKKYAKRHGWCDVVNQALKEMGVAEEEERALIVYGKAFDLLPIKTRVKPSELHGKDEDEQKAVIIQHIGKVSVMAGTAMTVLDLKPENLSDLTLDVPEEVAVDAPEGYTWGRNPTGRVLHLFADTSSEYRQYSQCGRGSVRMHEMVPEGAGKCVRCTAWAAGRA